MSDDMNKPEGSDPSPVPAAAPTAAPARLGWKRSTIVGGVLAVAILGAAAGAFAMRALHHGPGEMMPLKPTAVNELADDSIVAVQGSVAEIFGNKFVLADQTGRALVDTGSDGRGGIVKQGEVVTAQGRFDGGSLHAVMLVRADGKVETLRRGPGRHGPRHGWHGWGGRGWDDDAPPPAAGPVEAPSPAPQP